MELDHIAGQAGGANSRKRGLRVLTSTRVRLMVRLSANIGAIISSLIAILLTGACIRSYFVGDWWSLPTSGSSAGAVFLIQRQVGIGRGGIDLMRIVDDGPDEATWRELVEQLNSRFEHMTSTAAYPHLSQSGSARTYLGFGYDAYDSGVMPDGRRTSSIEIVFPVLPLVVLFLVLPGIRGAGVLRKRRRKATGYCLCCGYDLRASTGTCPECGRAVAKSPEKTLSDARAVRP